MNKNSMQILCPVCNSKMSSGLCSWHMRCSQCSYEKAYLTPSINVKAVHESINECAREVGLKSLRQANFQTLLSLIKKFKPLGGRLLEVGCAYGWFLETVRNDFDAIGLEPDEHVFRCISQNGFSVKRGYFPDAIGCDEKFDVIVFNDVIEHIPDIQSILRNCSQFLQDEGLLVLNMPNSNGFFYLTSKFLNAVGFRHFFERMWQVEMPSPHVHYFNFNNIALMLDKCDFKIEKKGCLRTLHVRNLYKRISFSKRHCKVTCFAIWLAVIICLPIISVFPGDIMLVVASKNK